MREWGEGRRRRRVAENFQLLKPIEKAFVDNGSTNGENLMDCLCN
jgi:hypothetical protein